MQLPLCRDAAVRKQSCSYKAILSPGVGCPSWTLFPKLLFFLQSHLILCHAKWCPFWTPVFLVCFLLTKSHVAQNDVPILVWTLPPLWSCEGHGVVQLFRNVVHTCITSSVVFFVSVDVYKTGFLKVVFFFFPCWKCVLHSSPSSAFFRV
jgi:hypothetical protein